MISLWLVIHSSGCLTKLSEVLKKCELQFGTKLGKVSFHGERGYSVGSSHFRKGNRG